MKAACECNKPTAEQPKHPCVADLNYLRLREIHSTAQLRLWHAAAPQPALEMGMELHPQDPKLPGATEKHNTLMLLCFLPPFLTLFPNFAFEMCFPSLTAPFSKPRAPVQLGGQISSFSWQNSFPRKIWQRPGTSACHVTVKQRYVYFSWVFGSFSRAAARKPAAPHRSVPLHELERLNSTAACLGFQATWEHFQKESHKKRAS